MSWSSCSGPLGLLQRCPIQYEEDSVIHIFPERHLAAAVRKISGQSTVSLRTIYVKTWFVALATEDAMADISAGQARDILLYP